MFDDIKKDKFDIIVAKDQTRLQRNTMDWYLFLNEIVQNQKILYLYLENTFFDPKDKFLFGIKAMMAEEYSRDLSKKGNAARKRRQEKGKPIITNRTWGFKNNNSEIYIDEEEADIIMKIYKMFADGMGGRAAAKILREDGVRNRNGKTLSENTIREIVKNPLYKGIVVMNKEHFDFEAKKIIKNPESEWIYREGLVPQIIQEDLWEKANQQLNSRKTMNRGKNLGVNKGNHFLSSKIICGSCGTKYWRNKRKQAVYWYCSEGACTSLHLKESELFFIIEALGNEFLTEKQKEQILDNAINQIYRALFNSDSNNSDNNINNNSNDKNKTEKEMIQIQKEKLKKKKEALLDFLLDGIITKSDYSSKIEDITEQIAVLDKREVKMQKKESGTKELLKRLYQVKELFKDKKERGIEVPLLCVHIEQIKVYENRLELYFDFFKDRPLNEPLSVTCHKNGRRYFYDMPMKLPSRQS